MAGKKALRQLQFAREASSDSGDVIAATTIWRGTGTIEDARDLHYIPEDVGILSGTDRTNTSALNGKLTLDATPATYEQAPHVMEMNIKTVTPVSDSGGGSGWIYTYPFPITSANALKPYCIRGGDDQQAEVINYVHGADFTLSGNEQKEWMITSNLFGRTVANTTFTGGLTLPVVYHMNFGKTKLYIDNDSNTWGTTLVSQTLLQASLKYTSGAIAKFTADGELYFSFVQMTAPKIELSVTFEHNTSAVSEKTNWRNETPPPRVIRLLNQGTALTTPGVYTYRSCIIDVVGKWLKFNKLGERNGNDVLEGTLTGAYNAARASAGSITFVNELSALP